MNRDLAGGGIRARRTRRVTPAIRAALEAAGGSAALEGVQIPHHHRGLAAAYLTGVIDQDAYRTISVALTRTDLGLDP